jgi:hypothetical protein
VREYAVRMLFKSTDDEKLCFSRILFWVTGFLLLSVSRLQWPLSQGSDIHSSLDI